MRKEKVGYSNLVIWTRNESLRPREINFRSKTTPTWNVCKGLAVGHAKHLSRTLDIDVRVNQVYGIKSVRDIRVIIRQSNETSRDEKEP